MKILVVWKTFQGNKTAIDQFLNGRSFPSGAKLWCVGTRRFTSAWHLIERPTGVVASPSRTGLIFWRRVYP